MKNPTPPTFRFQEGSRHDRLEGTFYELNHEEGGGIFERNRIIGSFGASCHKHVPSLETLVLFMPCEWRHPDRPAFGERGQPIAVPLSTPRRADGTAFSPVAIRHNV